MDRRNQETIATLLFLTAAEAMMGLAEYMIVSKAEGWTVLHDGTAEHDYATK